MLDSLDKLWLTVFNNALFLDLAMEVIIKTVDAIAFYSDAASLARNLGGF